MTRMISMLVLPPTKPAVMPERAADQQGEHDRRHAHEQRQPAAVDQAGEHVASRSSVPSQLLGEPSGLRRRIIDVL